MSRPRAWDQCCLLYTSVLKTGALAVPFNFRYSAEEIQYCADLAEVQVLVFGPEFIGRIETVADKLSNCLLYTSRCV